MKCHQNNKHSFSNKTSSTRFRGHRETDCHLDHMRNDTVGSLSWWSYNAWRNALQTDSYLYPSWCSCRAAPVWRQDGAILQQKEESLWGRSLWLNCNLHNCIGTRNLTFHAWQGFNAKKYYIFVLFWQCEHWWPFSFLLSSLHSLPGLNHLALVDPLFRRVRLNSFSWRPREVLPHLDP